MDAIIFNPNKTLDENGDPRVYGDHMFIWKDIDNPFSEDSCGDIAHYFDLPRAYDVMVKLLRNGDLYSYMSDEDVYINTDTNDIDDETLERITDKILKEFDESGIEFVLI